MPSTFIDALHRKVESIIADAEGRAQSVLLRKRRDAADLRSGNEFSLVGSLTRAKRSPSSFHRMLTAPKPMTMGMVHHAVKAEIAFNNLTILMRSDRSLQVAMEDERIRREVDDLVTQDCVDVLHSNINCYTVERKLRAVLGYFTLSKYYTFDGTCNNMVYKNRGSTPHPLKRLLPARYDALPATPRQRSVTKQLLPNPRVISNKLSHGPQKINKLFSLMGIAWGQIIDHDLDLTCAGNFDDNEPCESICSGSPKSACLPIGVPKSDSDLTCRAGRCIPFERSCPACTKDYRGARQQINQLTSYLDGGMVYGGPDPKEDEYWKNLVDLSTGKMRVGVSDHGTDLLPDADDDFGECDSGCLLGGDARATESTMLTSLHIVLLREHNRLVDELRAVNPYWQPIKLYLEARKILAGIVQHITLTGFLPVLLGRHLSHYYYSHSFDASVTNVFATASYRFAHSTLPDDMKRLDSNYKPMKDLPLRTTFFNSEHLRQPSEHGGLDSILRGLIVQGAFKVDNRFSDSIRNSLYESRNDSCGLDLLAINTQRGRDHGIPSYNEWRGFVKIYCRVTTGRVRSFDDLRYEIPQDRINILKSLYAHVDDIDLYVGAQSEWIHRNSATGPTFWCLNKLQFINIRHGDRLWYENPGVFTRCQLREIKKITLAKLLCRNGDSISRIPADVIRYSKYIHLVDCSTLPEIDLSYWSYRKAHYACR